MAHKMKLSEKKGLVGNRVSHAKNRTKVRLAPNLQTKRIYASRLGKFVTVRISASDLRTVTKIGIEAFCARSGIAL